jgi:hypothetical protein
MIHNSMVGSDLLRKSSCNNIQSGVDGGVTITDDGIGGKNYRFYLWNASPYSLTVVCDGDIFYGPTVDVNLYNNYNWVCANLCQ